MINPAPPRALCGFVTVGVGAFLLFAALAKLQAALPVPVSSSDTFLALQSELLLSQAELCLSIWLLLGVGITGSWLAAVVVFFCFALANTYFALSGSASCGCLGNLSMSPWTAIGIDVLVLAALAIGHPPFIDMRRAILVKELGTAAGITSLILGCAAIFVNGTHAEAMLAFVRDEPIYTTMIDMGTSAAESNHGHVQAITVTNATNAPIRIVGAQDSCLLTLTHDLPLEMPPFESRAIGLSYSQSVISTDPRASHATLLIQDPASQRLRPVIIHIRRHTTDLSRK